MKNLVRLFAVMLFIASPVMVFADPGGQGGPQGPKGQGVPDCECLLLGSWMGYDADGKGWWLSTANGQNATHGTLELQAVGAGQFYPPEFEVVDGTELKGAWRRTGRYTYEWVVIGYAIDVTGATAAITRLSGWNEIGLDCNTMTVNDMLLEMFPPNANLATDTTDDIVPFDPFPGLRILPELP